MGSTHRPSLLSAYRQRLLCVLACLTLAGCQRPGSAPPAAAVETPDGAAPKVTVVRPERKTVRRVIKRPGYNIEAYQSTPLYARTSGYVGKWHCDIGDHVRKGAVMAELSVPEMEVELEQKEAAVAQAEAEIVQARSAVLRAQAEHDRARSQHERLSRAGQTGVIDRENIEEVRFNLEAARAGVARAEADVKVASARLQVARKARDYTRALLEYTKIRAPFTGVVTQRNVNEGDFIQPVTGRKGDALFVVDQVDPVRVFVNVPEGEAVWVRNGAEALVRSQSLPGRELKGTVTRTARSLNPATRTLRTEIDLPNTNGELMPGMYVDVAITLEHRDVWSLPPSAILSEEEQTFCYQVVDGKAVRLLLQVGLRGDGRVEVLKKQTTGAGSGAEAAWEDCTGKEEIITRGGSGVKNGQAVTVSSGNP